MPEYLEEFENYFDLIDAAELKDKRVCDLGCGKGRWSYFLKDKCREMVLVDFSDAIFEARKTLACNDNIFYFMGDIQDIPFRDGFADFLFCLGVLHHMAVEPLNSVRKLKKFAPVILSISITPWTTGCGILRLFYLGFLWSGRLFVVSSPLVSE